MAEKRRRLRYGMIGGGSDFSVGVIHRNALRLNNEADLVAGIFSHNPDKSKKIAEDLGVTEERAYATPEEMVAAELKREDKIDFVVICTPNCYHYPASKVFLENGINVASDKPMCLTPEQAEGPEGNSQEIRRRYLHLPIPLQGILHPGKPGRYIVKA